MGSQVVLRAEAAMSSAQPSPRLIRQDMPSLPLAPLTYSRTLRRDTVNILGILSRTEMVHLRPSHSETRPRPSRSDSAIYG